MNIVYLYSPDRRRKHRLSMLYKIQNKIVDVDASDILRPSDRRTRGQQLSTNSHFIHVPSMSGIFFRLEWQKAPLSRHSGDRLHYPTITVQSSRGSREEIDVYSFNL